MYYLNKSLHLLETLMAQPLLRTIIEMYTKIQFDFFQNRLYSTTVTNIAGSMQIIQYHNYHAWKGLVAPLSPCWIWCFFAPIAAIMMGAISLSQPMMPFSDKVVLSGCSLWEELYGYSQRREIFQIACYEQRWGIIWAVWWYWAFASSISALMSAHWSSHTLWAAASQVYGKS